MAKKKAVRKSAKKTSVETPPALIVPQVFAQIELKAIRLLSATASLSISSNKLPGKLSTTVEAGCGANLEERTILSNVSVNAHAFVEHESDGLSSAEITVVFQCIFNTSDQVELTMENFRQHGIAQAIANTAVQIAWPYVRHHIQYTASSMGLPAFAVPLMRFGMIGNVQDSSRD